MRARLALAEEQLRRENGFVLTAGEALAQKDAVEALVVGQEAKDAELAVARAENAALAGENAAQAARIAELEALMVAP